MTCIACHREFSGPWCLATITYPEDGDRVEEQTMCLDCYRSMKAEIDRDGYVMRIVDPA